MKIGALIPIRLASERLSKKAIREICGRPVVYHLLDRVSASTYLDKKNVVVCTTEQASDDPLARIVEAYGSSVFRGSTDDIIKRFYDAIEANEFDAVIQVDGDDPLSDTDYMDLTMTKLLSDTSLDIVTCEGLPLGIASKSFTRSAMQKVYKFYQTEKNGTGFIYFFTKTGLLKQQVLHPIKPNHVLDEARLTLDYKEDFEVFETIFGALYEEGKLFGLEKIVKFLKMNPALMKTNNFLDQIYWERTKEKARLSYRDADGMIKNISYVS